MVRASEGEIPTNTHLNLISVMSFQFSKASKKDKKISQTIKTQTKENDTPQEQDTSNVIEGTDGDDYIVGTDGDDVIYAGDGNDTIYGGGGNDTIIAGEGNDTIVLHSDGEDSVDAGTGDDSIYVIYGQNGDDTIVQEDVRGEFTISGGDGDDTLYFEPSESSDDTESPSGDGAQGDDKQAGFDPITEGGKFFEFEKVQRIDHWNFDAVNWFSKADALAAIKALENQLISLDTTGMNTDPFKSPVFGPNANVLLGSSTDFPMAF